MIYTEFYSELNTVEKIAKYTKQQVDIFRSFQSKKREVVDKLRPIFAVESEGWKVVVDMGRFRKGFTRVLGVKGMKALKKLLYEIDDMYREITFISENED